MLQERQRFPLLKSKPGEPVPNFVVLDSKIYNPNIENKVTK
jgi:hypothetical protein